MKSLTELMKHSFRVYSRRNRIFFQSVLDRILFLNLAVGDFQDGVRKGASPGDLATALARIVSRIFCCVENYEGLPFIEMMMRKFPLTECAYCHQLPCTCSENRLDYVLISEVNTGQLEWALGQWSRHFEELYGRKNADQGVEVVILRLFKEVAELQAIVARVPELSLGGMTMKEIEEEIALELVDVMAWTIASANILGIDLEAAMVERYGTGCRKCGLIPCNCGQHSKEQLRWPLSVGK